MNSIYRQTIFIGSAPQLVDAPQDQGKEVAFAGRSNAGKSSVINALTQQKSLARTSKTPGRTQLLNFFAVDQQCKLVDLPGYGYAKVPLSVKNQWHQMMENYLYQREALCAIVLVMDIRRPLTAFDRQMMAWCEHARLPLHIVLTKADKLNFGAAKNVLLKVEKELATVNFTVHVQLFSALKKTGVAEIHTVLDLWFGY